MEKYLIVIAGPTAIGKTKVAIELALFLKCPIISADSRQFYKEMSIGTAKPGVEELQNVPHYFINNISIHHSYSVGQYETEALESIDKLFLTNKFIILVGGSGLYINAIINGFDNFGEIPTAIRESLIHDYETKGITFLRRTLKMLDPKYYEEVDLNNPQRVIRALEVCMHTNQPFSSFRKNENKLRSFSNINILLNTQRDLLYQKINDRVDAMFAKGLLEEVQNLHGFKYLNALNTVGYKELFQFLDGEITLERAIQLIKQNTRRYAKRQLTWFRNKGEYKSFEPNDIEEIKNYIISASRNF